MSHSRAWQRDRGYYSNFPGDELAGRLGAICSLLGDPFSGRGLTQREEQVARLLAMGFTHKQIGRELHLSHNTIKNHASRIIRKLEILNSRALTRILISSLAAILE